MLKKRLGINAIERNWYGYYSQLSDHFKISSSNLTIPEGCEKVGFSAFWECRFKEVVIPESVKKIEHYAFRSCRNLKEVVIPESVVKIGDWAFFGCWGLKKVEIPDSVDWIGDGAFQCCTRTTIILQKPESEFEFISPSAFTSCNVKEEIRA